MLTFDDEYLCSVVAFPDDPAVSAVVDTLHAVDDLEYVRAGQMLEEIITHDRLFDKRF